jgi:hypothetical protein
MHMLCKIMLSAVENAASCASIDPVSQVITTTYRKGHVTGETSTSSCEIHTVMCCGRHRHLNWVSGMQ